MQRAAAVRWFVLLVAGCAGLLPAAPHADAGERPNIILLVADDMRFDALGAVGNPIVQTPHLDRLAASGFVFREAFCTTAICATSRATILSGQYESRHGVRGFRTPLSDEAMADTFPARLRSAGYKTGFIGKWGLGGELPADQFDVWDGYSGQGRYFDPDVPGHLTGRMGDSAVEFVKSCTAEQPFLLHVAFKAAHVQDRAPRPFQPAPEYESLYRDVVIPTPATATDEAFAALPDFLQTSEARVRWERRFATPEMFQASVKDYYRLVTGIDAVVGRIVSALAQRKLADNTVILFTSDHGFYLGEHGLAGKWFMHEESIRVPLILHDPRSAAKPGSHVNQLALLTDIAPTILALAGLEIPTGMQGRSLLEVLGATPDDWRQDFFYEHHFEHPRIPQSEGVRERSLKYVRYLTGGLPNEELFDLASDPGELVNLAHDARYAERLDRLRARCNTLAAAAR